MSISEQVKELRYKADIYNTVGSAWELNRAEAKILQGLLRKAANTIESLSAKLADMERSAEDCGGWIYCGDGKNLPEEDKEVFIQICGRHINANFTDAYDFATYSNEKGWDLGSYPEWDNLEVLAWRELPEPYHEP